MSIDPTSLAAIRERDASWSDGYIAAEIANGGAGPIADRRALLAAYDEMAKELNVMRELLQEAYEQGMFWRGDRIYRYVTDPAGDA